MMGPNKDKLLNLEKRMKALGVKKADIEEKFIKSAGRGGQKVNKSSSAVFLKHKKTNLSVKCGKARSQHLNRFLALRSLVEKIEANMTGGVEKRSKKNRKNKKTKTKKKAENAKKITLNK
ncbi:MAG: peptide chain release factor-like protein [Desulfobacula sp.]|nr:peptide chain release factor-like protein [Desulfobacula sp.]